MLLAAACLLLATLAGCVSAPASPQVQHLDSSEIKVCGIAVLPFINESDFDQGDVILYRVFSAELNASGEFDVSLEGDVRRVYRQLRISPKQAPDNEQMQIIAERLGVDAVVTGRIIAMEERRHRDYNEPRIAVDMKMVAAGGRTMLTAYHARSGEDYRKVMHFGLETTVTGLARLLFDEILDNWRAKGLQSCRPPRE